MKTIGIIQPSYIPWRGFFDFVKEVDAFVFLDDVQYTTRDWRNRNRILTADGNPLWLTVPVKGGRNQLIQDVQIDNSQRWQEKHLNAIRNSYSKAPHFEEYYCRLESILGATYELLPDLDGELVRTISGWLGIDTQFVNSSSLETAGTKDRKLLEIVAKLGGDCYLSGPAAKAYIQELLWEEAGIMLRYKDYSGYPEYPQSGEHFQPSVSIVDLIFTVGDEAPDYIWGPRRSPGA